MPNWGETHAIRINAAKRDVDTAVTKINADLLHLPPRFRLTVNENGRDLKLIDTEAGSDPAAEKASPEPD